MITKKKKKKITKIYYNPPSTLLLYKLNIVNTLKSLKKKKN